MRDGAATTTLWAGAPPTETTAESAAPTTTAESAAADEDRRVSLVFFDLESTSLGTYEEHIIQIGAVQAFWTPPLRTTAPTTTTPPTTTDQAAATPPTTITTDQAAATPPTTDQETVTAVPLGPLGPLNASTFSEYVHTARRIHRDAQRVTGITPARLQGADSLRAVALRFLRWARRVSDGRPVRLVTYNGNTFDFRLWAQELYRHSLRVGPLWHEVGVTHLFDLLVWLRTRQITHTPRGVPLPRTPTGRVSYTLGGVYATHLDGRTFDAHDALGDSRAVYDLLAVYLGSGPDAATGHAVLPRLLDERPACVRLSEALSAFDELQRQRGPPAREPPHALWLATAHELEPSLVRWSPPPPTAATVGHAASMPAPDDDTAMVEHAVVTLTTAVVEHANDDAVTLTTCAAAAVDGTRKRSHSHSIDVAHDDDGGTPAKRHQPAHHSNSGARQPPLRLASASHRHCDACQSIVSVYFWHECTPAVADGLSSS
jgi:DNA polymerase III epsilon subunit-like protein